MKSRIGPARLVVVRRIDLHGELLARRDLPMDLSGLRDAVPEETRHHRIGIHLNFASNEGDADLYDAPALDRRGSGLRSLRTREAKGERKKRAGRAKNGWPVRGRGAMNGIHGSLLS